MYYRSLISFSPSDIPSRERGRPPSSLHRSTGEELATESASAAAEQYGRVHQAPGTMDFPLDPIER
jgi:hypothetical protein